MTHDADDESLFDPDAPASPEVARLERLLRPLGAREGAPLLLAARRPRRVPPLVFSVCAAAALVGGIAWLAGPPAREAPPSPPAVEPRPEEPKPAEAPMHCFAEGGKDLAPGQWIVTGDDSREIEIAARSNVTLGPNTRVQVRHVRDDEARLYLQQGRIEALVSADARPRFFQVDTDAARCVDLGCRYTLDVDDAGTATVRVTTGQVAFEHDGRDVFIPAGAVCVARKGRGPGTPRFEDASPELKAAFDAYDAVERTPGHEEEIALLAQAAAATVTTPRDTLSLWHLLGEDNGLVEISAESRLAKLLPAPEGLARVKTRAERSAAWRTVASQNW